jgi:Fur family zinc uptake transcriptional regulator
MLCYNITMNNNDIVFEIIKKSKNHLTAYEILNKFQNIKKVQPMSVYRSLNKLISENKIHKSNQTKKYMLCNHSHKNHNPSIAICKKCGETEELNSNLFEEILNKKIFKKYDFKNYELEVSAICKACN